LGGSEYLKVMHDLVRGVPPALDLEAERALQTLLVTLADQRLVRSAHDCSDGGIAVAIAESTFDTTGIGADVSLAGVDVARDPAVNVAAALFGESASRVVVSVVPEHVTTMLRHAAAASVPARVIGQTGGSRLRLAVAGDIVIDQSVDEAERVWSTAIDRHFVQRVA
jgi:phosphoribosylformylglycinamidine synthase